MKIVIIDGQGGRLGSLSADSLLGEVTPAMGQSRAQKLLLPVNRCNNHVIGAADLTIPQLIEQAAKTLLQLISNTGGASHGSCL